MTEEYGDVRRRKPEGADDFEDDENSAPIVKLGNRIIEDAYVKGAQRHPHRALSTEKSACATASTAFSRR